MKNIKGFENYLIDEDGNVYRNINGKIKKLNGTIISSGYNRVMLYKNAKPHGKLTHRLVLEAYIGKCPEKMEACHYDGNPLNNNIKNLRWGYRWENARDTMRHGMENVEKRLRCSSINQRK